MEEEKKKSELLMRLHTYKELARDYRAVGFHYNARATKSSCKYNKECMFLGFIKFTERFPVGYASKGIGYCREENCDSITMFDETNITCKAMINHLRKNHCLDFKPVEAISKVRSKKNAEQPGFLGFLNPSQTLEETFSDENLEYRVIKKNKTNEEFIELTTSIDQPNGLPHENDKFTDSSDCDEDSESEKSTPDNTLCEYERIRRQNIKERTELLIKMGFMEEKKKIKKKKIKVKPIIRRNCKPRRSSRISKCFIDFLELPYDCSDDEVKKVHVRRPNSYGKINDVPIGKWWDTRIECNQDGIHRPTVAGIHSGPEGAYSVVLSGGYEDDIDCGESFTYTGSGGRDLKGTKMNPKNLRTAPQSKDQTLDRNNASLVYSYDHQKPVRVVRGYKLKSCYAPEKGYRYDGLYAIEKWWVSKGASGFLTYKFLFTRLVDQDPPPWKSDDLIPEAAPAFQEKSNQHT